MGNRWAGAGLRRCVFGAGAPGRGAGVGVCSGLGTPPRLLAGAAHRAGSVRRMQGAGKALHELLLSAQRQGCLTAGVYESAKVLNV